MSLQNQDFIDVDQTVLQPSPKRIRNILTLKERVDAIRAYDCRPMYTKVAKMFNCSWEQIKSIVANREAIMEFYEATNKEQNGENLNIIGRKIDFLGECLYEYLQRMQYHRKADITVDLILTKAIEFRDLMQIDDMVINRAWVNHFKAAYNFSLANRQLNLNRVPPASLDFKDIMTYCSCNKVHKHINVPRKLRTIGMRQGYETSTGAVVLNANTNTNANDNCDETQKRARKIHFLEKAMLEYMQRAKVHHKMLLNDKELLIVAHTLRDMLKIEAFNPCAAWLNSFRHELQHDDRTPPFSIDLKDILSFCSRTENKVQPVILPQKPKPVIRILNHSLMPNQPQAGNSRASATVIATRATEQQLKLNAASSLAKTDIKEEVVSLSDEEQPEEQQRDVKPDIANISLTKESIAMVQLPKSAVCPDADKELAPPPLKIRKFASILPEHREADEEPSSRSLSACSNATYKAPHSPGHYSEHSEDDEPLPKHAANYLDALKLLKPLEEFAMLKENYRAIGLISQLEEIFKTCSKK